ncbi:unnamed protein product [Periconia digitata]|uniref:FAD-binding PCMH-type domain-containing protein n=1 Tax=Periconia digitata TaxID=1303443 RepID=A0A9W4XQH9_9PLEO|nr:unnamed protein product [Periconia digitata]
MEFTKRQLRLSLFTATFFRLCHSTATLEQWQTLNATLGGRLHAGVPIAESCFSQEGYHSSTYITGQFGGYTNANWATCQKTAQGCSLDWLDPFNSTVFATGQVCHQGSVPPFYIDVRNVSDIQAGLKFAKITGTPLTIKNTGHDYQGRSSAPGSLALWTHNIRPEIKLANEFIPEGCSAPVQGKAVTFGAGQQFGGLYDFGNQNNVTIIGGISSTVGTAGGWIAGGGHSQISNAFGLGVDNVLQIKTVLPNGTLITANECQNQDMWFALRGGGGGTFGVNYEMTSKAWPVTSLRVAFVTFDSSHPTTTSTFLSIMIENASRWAKEGWSGHFYGGANYSQASGYILATPLLSKDEASASMQPVFDKLSASLGNVTLTAEMRNYDTFYDFYEEILLPAGQQIGVATAFGGRLVPSSSFEGAENQAKLRDALLSVKAILTYPTRNTTDPNVVKYGAPFVVQAVSPNNYPTTAANDTSSIPPVWRDSIWNVVANLPFSNQASADEIQRAFQGGHEAAEVLREAMPDSAAYSNEADLYETNYTTSFWGEKNYERLLSIKKEIDPDNLLTCWHCVGWNPDDAKYGCYPTLSA